ncbi:MAG: hypothetical protein M1839_004505 [Geoglossum umbratile]|nr:MAG: hypothetical protein M1839_004505 [Geoglossum umbratile]
METKLPYKWPFAPDILKRQYDALPPQHLLAFQSQFFDKMGPNMELRLFGNVGYMTTDPKNIEALLSTRFDGMAPAGRYQNLKVLDEHVNDLVTNLSSSSGIVDLQPAFFRFTLATTASTHLRLGDEDRDIFANSFDYASLICAICLRLADFHWAYTPSKFTKACGIANEYANHFVKQALKDKEDNEAQAASGRYAFILDLYEELKDPALVRDQLVNVLIVGRDTTACLLSWTL